MNPRSIKKYFNEIEVYTDAPVVRAEINDDFSEVKLIGYQLRIHMAVRPKGKQNCFTMIEVLKGLLNLKKVTIIVKSKFD